VSRDVLLYGLSQSEEMAYLVNWMQTTSGLHKFPAPDGHRLQLEHWLWTNRARMTGRVMDVGVYIRREWVGPGYFTFGEHGEDIKGDLCAIPFEDASIDVAIVTEVLEHCANPFAAVAELYRVVKPGGLLFVTSPFFWPTHGIEGEYQDYWRFTRQGWELLFARFASVSVVPCGWTTEGAAAYDLMRRFECQGFANQTEATTGYLVDVVR
jgi:SAM-dependent methyltransferase